MAQMVPSSAEVSERMAHVRTRDTHAELAIRRELHRRGWRYRVACLIPGAGRIRPDIVFTKRRVAVFVDGCFWHRCPEHASFPKTNSQWWADKLETNVRRDRKNDRLLSEAGWTVIRMWEHQDPADAADQVEALLEASA